MDFLCFTLKKKIALFLAVASLFSLQQTDAVRFHNVSEQARGRKQTSGCNIFLGNWVIDPSFPPYEASNCAFIDSEFNCAKRPDKQYLKYSWKPESCSLPRFDGKDLLNRWRGKKIMFVGDSLSLNMWESLACMIHASVPYARISFLRKQPLSTVIFQEYGVTIMLFRTPYLVDIVKEDVGKVLTLDSIKEGDAWKGMDVLIFNSWHWWVHTGKSQGWDYIRDGSKLVKNMDRFDAYLKGMTTWAKWVDLNVDPSKTKVFFQGISPTHYQGKEWNEPNKKTCNGQQEPLSGSTYPAGLPPATTIVNNVLKNMRTPVSLLDITLLSQLRKDAHPSVYAAGHSGNDCSHWCLPGLPDTWNQLLYAAQITM